MGTVADDEYGLNTSVGAGKRIGHVAGILTGAEEATLQGPLRVQIWLVQDSEGRVAREVDWVVAVLKDLPAPRVEVTVLDLRESDIHR